MTDTYHYYDTVQELFAKYADEHNRFEAVQNKPHPTRDVCAMLILSARVAVPYKMVSAAEHDQVWFAVDPGAFMAAGGTEEEILTLIRCGVRYSEGSFCMFV